jgi:hypothetical protein
MIPTKANNPIPLNLQLASGSEGKFVLAYLVDKSGVSLAESPVSLEDIGGGFYIDYSVLMPEDKDLIFASYKVYDDENHTIKSESDGDAEDVFVLDDSGEANDDNIIGFLDDRSEIFALLNPNEDTLLAQIED